MQVDDRSPSTTNSELFVADSSQARDELFPRHLTNPDAEPRLLSSRTKGECDALPSASPSSPKQTGHGQSAGPLKPVHAGEFRPETTFSDSRQRVRKQHRRSLRRGRRPMVLGTLPHYLNTRCGRFFNRPGSRRFQFPSTRAGSPSRRFARPTSASSTRRTEQVLKAGLVHGAERDNARTASASGWQGSDDFRGLGKSRLTQSELGPRLPLFDRSGT